MSLLKQFFRELPDLKEAYYIWFLRNIRTFIAVVLFSIVIIFVLILACEGGEIYTNEQIVNAIFKAEGGYKAQYLYGIVSIKYKDEAEARRICFNTVRNQRKRHAQHDCDFEYLECLQRRYCPIGAKNDPKGLNKNWLKNVKYFLTKNP